MLPQMMPLPWLFIFVFIFFCIFSISLYFSFFGVGSVNTGKHFKLQPSNLPW